MPWTCVLASELVLGEVAKQGCPVHPGRGWALPWSILPLCLLVHHSCALYPHGEGTWHLYPVPRDLQSCPPATPPLGLGGGADASATMIR